MDDSGNRKNKIFGNYELLETLGTGAEGQVYKAKCLKAIEGRAQEGDIVAVKVLTRSPSLDAKEELRFKRQVTILEQLQHPNICRYIDDFIESEGEFDERRCLVMEYIDGIILTDRMKRYPHGLPWEEVRELFTQCLEGLAHAAEQGVFHRDLKPSNMIITHDGKAKIIDFGIARQEGGEETSTGGWRGSFDYMAPDFVRLENFRGDEQSDIYSMGIFFYMALTGELPFERFGENAHIGYLNRWKGDDEPRPSFRHKVFRVLTRTKPFVLGCLNVDRNERDKTFREMLDGLSKIKFRIVRHKGVEDYELIDMLGRGGFGEVFKGRQASDGKLVAVKHLFADRQASRFIKEAQLLQKYNHPDIVNYIDFIEIEGLGADKEFFLIMEHLAGMPGSALNNRIRKAKTGIEAAEVIELFIHYLSALQFLHENPRPIIHRDIKPGNLYAPPGQPQKAKIFDLGVARDVSGTLTTGMIPGTLDYMAPEFAKPGSDRGSSQSDIYALGVSMYESLTGRKPYPRFPKSDQEAFVQFVARAQNPPPVDYTHPAFKDSPELAQIVGKSIDTNLKKRYARCKDMLEELQAMMDQIAGEDIDEHDAPTRATIADPGLIERLRAHRDGKPVFIPPSELETILEAPLEPQEVQDRPDWLEEEQGTPMEMPSEIMPPGTSQASPVSGGTGPKVTVVPPRKSPAIYVAAIAVLIAVGLGAFVLLRQQGVVGGGGAGNSAEAKDPRQSAIDWLKSHPSAEATQAFVRDLQLMLISARQQKVQDVDFKDWWDLKIVELSDVAEQVPAAFSNAFVAATTESDPAAMEGLQTAWQDIGDAVSIMSLTLRDYVAQADQMRDQLALFEFDAEFAALRRRIPDSVSASSDARGIEGILESYWVLKGKPWNQVSAEEKTAAFEEIETRLTNLVRTFIDTEKSALVDSFADDQDVRARAKQFVSLPETTPLLFDLVAAAMSAAATEVQNAEQRYEQLQMVADTLNDLRDAVPAAVSNLEDAAKAELATVDYLSELDASWAGISAEDKAAALNRIRDNLTSRTTAYIVSLQEAAVKKYAGDAAEVGEEEILVALADAAPELIALVETRYSGALSAVAGARKACAARVAEAEQTRLAMLADKEREEHEARIAANLLAFETEAKRLQGTIPATVSSAAVLAGAEASLQELAGFATKSWPDVEVSDRDRVVTAIRKRLASAASAYVADLGAAAKTKFEELETESPEWNELNGLRDQAPSVIALIEDAYGNAILHAEVALNKMTGLNEFTMALSNVRSQIPDHFASGADVNKAEKAAEAYEDVVRKSWDMVSEEDRTAALERVRATLAGKASAYINQVRDAAVEQLSAQKSVENEVKALTAFEENAPTLLAMVGDGYRSALKDIRDAKSIRDNIMKFRNTVAGVDASVPGNMESGEDVIATEKAAAEFQDIAVQDWPNITDASRLEALQPIRDRLETLTLAYIQGVQKQAVDQFNHGEDGSVAMAALEEFESKAPTLTGFVDDRYQTARVDAEAAQTAWMAAGTFQRVIDQIAASIPAEIRDGEQLAETQKATTGYLNASAMAWDGIEPLEKTAAFGDLRKRLIGAGKGYVANLKDTAIKIYGDLEDADPVRDTLIAAEQVAPDLIELIDSTYRIALSAVDSAKEKRSVQLAAMADEERRQEEIRLEEARLAKLRSDEELVLQEVRDAWVQVQETWKTNEDADLSAQYEVIFGGAFEVEEFKNEFAQLRDEFMTQLKGRMSSLLGGAESSIAGFRSHSYQVYEPALSESYRFYDDEDEIPTVAFNIPKTEEAGGDSMGVSRWQTLRLRAWSKAGAKLEDEKVINDLAKTLAGVASGSRKDGDTDVAALCEMESELLFSKPGYFPSQFDEAAEPLEIFRWRAHANYQPETSALDVLGDMERYATRRGELNEYDVEMTLFASYYSWRNAIKGEHKYAERVRKALESVLAGADERTSEDAFTFVLDVIDRGGDDADEYPGLYLIKALSAIDSKSPMSRQASKWMKDNASAYQERINRIDPQINLLKELLGLSG